MSRRISARQLEQIRNNLSLPDLDALGLLRDHRFLTTAHLSGLVHGTARTPLASRRAAERQIRKLDALGLVGCLPRRVGGFGGGAAAAVWHLSEAGQRLLRLDDRDETGNRQRWRFSQPSPRFVAHALAVADVRLTLERLDDTSGGTASLSLVQTEPQCWRHSIGAYGVRLTLRPDLYAEISSSEFVDMWFIEVDLATEHMPAIVKKAAAYEQYRRTGREQADRGAFPRVLWVAPTQQRADAIRRAIAQAANCNEKLHAATTFDGLSALLTTLANNN